MQKKDLKDGMEVTLRNGQTLLVKGGNLIGDKQNYELIYFANDLTRHASSQHHFDIVSVTQPKTILWTREDENEFTINGKPYSEETIYSALKAYVE